MLRGILISHLFRKTLNVSHNAGRRQPTVRLGSTDIEQFVSVAVDAHVILVAFAEVVVGASILVSYVGQAALIQFIPFVCEFTMWLGSTPTIG